MKILFTVCVILGIVSYICFNNIASLKKEIKNIENEKKDLLLDLQRRDNNDAEKKNKKEESEILANQDKENFDWKRDISNSPVVLRMQKSCRSCRKIKTD